MKQKYIHRRKDGTYYFVINVPKDIRTKIKFNQVWRSLKTKDEKEASWKVSKYISQYKEIFLNFSNGSSSVDLENVCEISRKLGFVYQDHERVCSAPVTESISILSSHLLNLEKLREVSTAEVAALGGAVPVESLSMTKLFGRFKQLAPDKVTGSDKRETKRKWRRFELATEDFVMRMPNHADVLKIEPRHATEYRAKLIDCVNNGIFKSDVVRKRLLWLRTIFDVVYSSDYPALQNPFSKLRGFKFEDAGKRKPFSETEVRRITERLGTSKISAEAKAIMVLGRYTGCSAKELVLVEPQDIHLQAKIPYINIQPNSSRSKVKNGGSRHRSIPLVDEALEVMKSYPKGFPSFRVLGGPDRINRAMSDFFKKHVPGKGFYSFRHRIDDLLKNSGCDLGVKAGTMGHALEGNNSYYGEGYTLDLKYKALVEAFKYSIKIEEDCNNEGI